MLSTEQIVELRNKISQIENLDRKRLIERPEWGTIKFDTGQDDINSIFGIIDLVSRLPLEYLTDTAFSEFNSTFSSVLASLSKIDGFRLEGGDPAQIMRSIVGELRPVSELLTERTRSWIPYLAYQKGDIQENIRQLSIHRDEADLIVKKLDAFSSEKMNDINDIVRATREASAEAGVGVFTQDFANLGVQAGKTAKKWLIATIALASITLFLAILLIFWIPVNLAQEKLIVYFVVNKVVLFSILISAMIWSGQIYKATMHQKILNEHRASSLKTFQAFVQATTDEMTRNAVLIETTRSIFAMPVSGFVQNSDSSFDPGAKIFEVFKASTGSK